MISQKPAANKARLFFIDNIRLLMIIMVVLIHTSVTYSGIGGWYYVENRSLDTVSTVFFGIFNTYSQAFFMGFLFLIAGYFIPSTYDRKGCGKFIKDRLFRLGVPLLVYIFIINPFLEYYLIGTIVNNTAYSLWDYFSYYIKSLNFIGGTGPLWFALALLIFSIIYGLIRLIRVKPSGVNNINKFPGSLPLALIIVLISVLNFVVRIFQPFGTNIYNMQLCFFPQYIVYFILGITAYRKNWLLTIPHKFGMNWFKAALILGTLVWILLMVFGGPLNGQPEVILGGLYWQSAVYALWEQFLSAGICMGLIVIFRDRHNSQGRFAKFLSDNAFGVYVFHAPILISVSLLFRGISMYPVLKFIFIAVIALPACFLISSIIRKVPIFKKVFS